MRALRIVFFPALGLLMFGTSLPASAEPSDDTTATVIVTGGALRITAPGDAGNLGRRDYSAKKGAIRGNLGQVKVTDTRGAAEGAGWVASVVSSSLQGPADAVIPASTVDYSVGPITKDGTATYTANDPKDISDVSAAVTATEISGENTATWDPTITVHVPGGTPAGTYSVTLTHSVI